LKTSERCSKEKEKVQTLPLIFKLLCKRGGLLLNVICFESMETQYDRVWGCRTLERERKYPIVNGVVSRVESPWRGCTTARGSPPGGGSVIAMWMVATNLPTSSHRHIACRSQSEGIVLKIAGNFKLYDSGLNADVRVSNGG
jgi:hypothetical protein